MEDKDRSGGKARYCVLYTQALKQWSAGEALQRALPGGMGEVFYPCRELWWHGSGKTVFRPLFPGYIFIRSGLDGPGLHELVLGTRREIASFVKELGAGRETGLDASCGGSDLLDLTDEEAGFFDFLLGFAFDADLDRRREEAAGEGRLYKPAPGGRAGQQSAESMRSAEDADAGISGREESPAAKLRRRRKRIPKKGVVQMSFGYMEDGRHVVMDGPLKGREGHIRGYIAKDRKAVLDTGIGGKPAKVGLTLLSKKVWFPGDKGSPDILPDGTAVDTRELARIMMGGPKASKGR